MLSQRFFFGITSSSAVMLYLLKLFNVVNICDHTEKPTHKYRPIPVDIIYQLENSDNGDSYGGHLCINSQKKEEEKNFSHLFLLSYRTRRPTISLLPSSLNKRAGHPQRKYPPVLPEQETCTIETALWQRLFVPLNLNDTWEDSHSSLCT